MDHAEVKIHAEHGFRATEVIADLRNVAEILFNPLKLVGFWDNQADGMHLCPEEQLGRQCPHKLPPEDPLFKEYSVTADEYMRAVLEVAFPHAGLVIYLK